MLLIRRRNTPVGWLCFFLRLCALALAGCILCGLTLHTASAPVRLILLADRTDSASPAADILSSYLDSAMETAFGYDAVIILSIGRAEDGADAVGAPDVTNLEDALRAAQVLLSEGEKGHILLLSDGLETDGDGLSAARSLARRENVRMDAVWLDSSLETPEAEIAALNAPMTLVQGQSFTVEITCKANARMSASLRIVLGNTVAADKKITLSPGENTFSVKLNPTQSGLLTYQAELVPAEDTLARNNLYPFCVQVVTGETILLAEGTEGNGQALEALLREEGFSTQRLSASRLPTDMSALSQYAVIVLMDVDVQNLSQPQQRLLNEYVNKYGHSVLAAGGVHSYAFGHMKDTPIEKMLPVTSDAPSREEHQSIALALIIDNSASMGENQTKLANASDSSLNAAKKGAIQCIDLLGPGDQIAIISFSETARVIYPMSSVDEKEEILNAISRMGTLDGTNFTAALNLASEMFAAVENPRKFAVFISDGNPSDTEYEEAAQRLRAQGVTLSAIGVGNAVNKGSLQRLAEIGGGHFSVTSADQSLADLMAADTTLMQSDYLALGSVPVLNERGEHLPAVTGYVRTRVRKTAQVLWREERGDPLLTLWTYGAGKAAALAFDLSGEWSQAWFSTAQGRSLLTELVRSLSPAQAGRQTAALTLEAAGENTLVRFEALDSRYAQVEVRTETPSGTAEARMVEVSRGQFEARLPALGDGAHPMTLLLTETDGAVIRVDTAAACRWPAEYEAFPAENGEKLLREMAGLCGGTVSASLPSLDAETLKDLRVSFSLSPALALAALLLLILEIFLRAHHEKYGAKQKKHDRK